MALGILRSFRPAPLTLVLLGALAIPAMADPLALIAAVQGRVEVASSGSRTVERATFGRALDRGDRVTVGPGGKATLAFSDGSVIELSEKSSITVGARLEGRRSAGTGSGLPGDVFTQVSKYVTGGSRQTGLVALAAMRETSAASPLLVSPRNSDVPESRPAFRWRAVEGAVRYRVVVSGDAGELWSREVSQPATEYPADQPALAADADYLWSVEAFGDHGSLRREEGTFHVLGSGQAAAILGNLQRILGSAGGPQSPAARFLAGLYLSSRGLYRDAAEQFESLTQLIPESPAPHEALGGVYRAIGLMDRATAEFQRAFALTPRP